MLKQLRKLDEIGLVQNSISFVTINFMCFSLVKLQTLRQFACCLASVR